LWLEKPDWDKKWGIVLENMSLTRVLLERTINSLSYNETFKNFPILEKIKQASPFFQCKTDDYLYVEFWCSQNIALDAAFILAEHIDAPLNIR